MGWGWGKEVPEKGETHIYLQLIHLVVWQKPTLHCKAITLQFKKSITLKKEVSFKEPHPISPEVGVPPLHAGAAPPAGGWPVSPGGSAVHHLQGLSPAVPGPWPEGVPTGRGCSEVKVEGLLQGCHAGRRSLLYTDTPNAGGFHSPSLVSWPGCFSPEKGAPFLPNKGTFCSAKPPGAACAWGGGGPSSESVQTLQALAALPGTASGGSGWSAWDSPDPGGWVFPGILWGHPRAALLLGKKFEFWEGGRVAVFLNRIHSVFIQQIFEALSYAKACCSSGNRQNRTDEVLSLWSWHSKWGKPDREQVK